MAALRLGGRGLPLLEQEMEGGGCLGPSACEDGVGHTLDNREGTPKAPFPSIVLCCAPLRVVGENPGWNSRAPCWMAKLRGPWA